MYRNKNKKQEMKGKNYLTNSVGIDSIDCCRFLYFYFTLPHWKGIYIGGVGLFLTINLLIIAFLSTKISRNDILEFKTQNICNFFPLGAFFQWL